MFLQRAAAVLVTALCLTLAGLGTATPKEVTVKSGGSIWAACLSAAKAEKVKAFRGWTLECAKKTLEARGGNAMVHPGEKLALVLPEIPPTVASLTAQIVEIRATNEAVVAQIQLTLERAQTENTELAETNAALTDKVDELTNTAAEQAEEILELKANGAANAATANDHVAELEARVTELESNVITLTEQVAEKQATIEKMETEHGQLLAEIATLRSGLGTPSATITATDQGTQIATLEARIKQLEAQVATKDATIVELQAAAPKQTLPQCNPADEQEILKDLRLENVALRGEVDGYLKGLTAFIEKPFEGLANSLNQDGLVALRMLQGASAAAAGQSSHYRLYQAKAQSHERLAGFSSALAEKLVAASKAQRECQTDLEAERTKAAVK